MSLDIDMQPLFDSINEFFPVIFSAISIAGGISIALALAVFLIDKIRKAFN